MSLKSLFHFDCKNVSGFESSPLSFQLIWSMKLNVANVGMYLGTWRIGIIKYRNTVCKAKAKSARCHYTNNFDLYDFYFYSLYSILSSKVFVTRLFSTDSYTMIICHLVRPRCTPSLNFLQTIQLKCSKPH